MQYGKEWKGGFVNALKCYSGPNFSGEGYLLPIDEE